MRIKDGKVWDAVREKWLVLTPEEWVRQYVIAHLTDKLGVESHRIGREVLLDGKKRADIVVYDRTGSPVLIVECKAQSVAITEDVFEQIARYNISLGMVRYLVVTNGKDFYCCEFDRERQTYVFIEDIPSL